MTLPWTMDNSSYLQIDDDNKTKYILYCSSEGKWVNWTHTAPYILVWIITFSLQIICVILWWLIPFIYYRHCKVTTETSRWINVCKHDSNINSCLPIDTSPFDMAPLRDLKWVAYRDFTVTSLSTEFYYNRLFRPCPAIWLRQWS